MVESQKARMRSYRDLKVWQRAMDLTVRTYEITRRFPAEEKYGASFADETGSGFGAGEHCGGAGKAFR